MKKNWILRLGVLAMVLTLVTMPMVSSTYAKYVTEDSASDTARVAEWGVTVAVTGNAFNTTSAIAAATDDENGDPIVNSVVSSNTDNLIAPGTSGTFTGVAITGTPEVAVNISIVPALTLTGWTADGNFYCPIVFTVNGSTINGYSYTTAAALEAVIESAIEAAEGNYAANVDLSAIDDLSGDYAWSWAFETDDGDAIYIAGTNVSSYFVNTGTGTGAAATGTFVAGTTYYNTLAGAQAETVADEVDTSAFVEELTYNEADTALGNLGTLPTIELTVTATVSQIN